MLYHFLYILQKPGLELFIPRTWEDDAWTKAAHFPDFQMPCNQVTTSSSWKTAQTLLWHNNCCCWTVGNAWWTGEMVVRTCFSWKTSTHYGVYHLVLALKMWKFHAQASNHSCQNSTATATITTSTTSTTTPPTPQGGDHKLGGTQQHSTMIIYIFIFYICIYCTVNKYTCKY